MALWLEDFLAAPSTNTRLLSCLTPPTSPAYRAFGKSRKGPPFFTVLPAPPDMPVSGFICNRKQSPRKCLGHVSVRSYGDGDMETTRVNVRVIQHWGRGSASMPPGFESVAVDSLSIEQGGRRLTCSA